MPAEITFGLKVPPPSASKVMVEFRIEPTASFVAQPTTGVSQIVSRHAYLVDLRNALAAELRVRLYSPTVIRLLNILTIIIATWYGRTIHGDREASRFGLVVQEVWGAVHRLGGGLPVRSVAEIMCWRGRAICGETSFWLMVNERMFKAAAKYWFHLKPSHHTVLGAALALPPGAGGVNWQNARSPVGLVIDTARRNYMIDDLYQGGGSIPVTDAMYRGRRGKVFREPLPILSEREKNYRGIRLEHLAETPGEAVLVKHYTVQSLDVLRREAEDDADLNTYLAARIKVGGGAQEAWKLLGWTQARGQRVDRKLRRLRSKLKQNPELVEIGYEADGHTASAGSHFHYRELLFDGYLGTARFIFQHVPSLTA